MQAEAPKSNEGTRRRLPRARPRAGGLAVCVSLAVLSCLGAGCSGSDSTPPDAATTIAPVSGTALEPYAVRATDLPVGWSEAKVDLSQRTPSVNPVCLVDVGDPAQVVDAVVWEVAPDALYEQKIATSAVTLASPDLGEELDQSLADGSAAQCVQDQVSAGFATTATTTSTAVESQLDASYLIHTTATVSESPASSAMDFDQNMLVLRKGDTVVILELNSGVGPFPADLQQELIDTTIARLGA